MTLQDIKEEIIVEESPLQDDPSATSIEGVAVTTSGEDPQTTDEAEHGSGEDPGEDSPQGPEKDPESDSEAQGVTSKARKTKRQQTLEQLRWLRREHIQNYTPLRANILAKTVPFKCSAECPLFGECPEVSDGLCSAERTVFLNSFYSYMEELNVDPHSALEVQSVGELATIDVLESRCLNILSKEGILTDAPTFPMGDKVINEASGNPTFEVLQVLWKRRSQVRKELASTRDQKQRLTAALAGRKTGAEWLSELMGMVREAGPQGNQ